MHSVQRSTGPDFLTRLRDLHTEWRDLGERDRVRIRSALRTDFNGICAYCEITCVPPTGGNNIPNEETIDHFRPRNRFPNLWLDWLNLMYACRRCNQSKGGRWPGYDDELTDQFLAAEDSRYTPVSTYITPNTVGSQKPAGQFFDFNVRTGEVMPAEELEPAEWSMARKTIRDIDLNDSQLGENDVNHLWNRRQDWLGQVLGQLDTVEDFDDRVTMLFEFALPNQPFSGFVYAYIMDRFPILNHLFQRR